MDIVLDAIAGVPAAGTITCFGGLDLASTVAAAAAGDIVGFPARPVVRMRSRSAVLLVDLILRGAIGCVVFGCHGVTLRLAQGFLADLNHNG